MFYVFTFYICSYMVEYAKWSSVLTGPHEIELNLNECVRQDVEFEFRQCEIELKFN